VCVYGVAQGLNSGRILVCFLQIRFHANFAKLAPDQAASGVTEVTGMKHHTKPLGYLYLILLCKFHRKRYF
jgi:hypothetical protein